MNSINNKLKELNLKRNQSSVVGKVMGQHTWIHKDYVYFLITKENYLNFLNKMPYNFDFNILRLNKTKDEIIFINSPDFDLANEPIVGHAIKINLEDDNYPLVNHRELQNNNPLIYHHKWMFVCDDYQGFDVEQSKQRSVQWKSVLGKNKFISSKIGRLQFWEQWLKENNLAPRINNSQKSYQNKNQSVQAISSVWDIYFQENKNQNISSSKTARNQLPASFKLIQNLNNKKNQKILDIGCGSQNELFKTKLLEKGYQYFGCDPFNKSFEENKKSIIECMNGQVDIVTVNNVLNTIQQTSVQHSILKQAHNALNPETGLMIIITYEGNKLQHEKHREQQTGQKIKKLKPIQTRDGWQNRQPTEYYLNLVQSVFENACLIKLSGQKYIVASINPNIDLKSLFKIVKK